MQFTELGQFAGGTEADSKPSLFKNQWDMMLSVPNRGVIPADPTGLGSPIGFSGIRRVGGMRAQGESDCSEYKIVTATPPIHGSARP
nr:hypothetical protein [Magnetospirillum gryphiswaldense]